MHFYSYPPILSWHPILIFLSLSWKFLCSLHQAKACGLEPSTRKKAPATMQLQCWTVKSVKQVKRLGIWVWMKPLDGESWNVSVFLLALSFQSLQLRQLCRAWRDGQTHPTPQVPRCSKFAHQVGGCTWTLEKALWSTDDGHWWTPTLSESLSESVLFFSLVFPPLLLPSLRSSFAFLHNASNISLVTSRFGSKLSRRNLQLLNRWNHGYGRDGGCPLGERREDSQQPATFDDGSWCHNLSDGNDFVN